MGLKGYLEDDRCCKTGCMADVLNRVKDAQTVERLARNKRIIEAAENGLSWIRAFKTVGLGVRAARVILEQDLMLRHELKRLGKFKPGRSFNLCHWRRGYK